MTFTYKLSRRLALGHLGLTAFAAGVIAACSGGEPTAPTTSGTTDLLAAVKIAPKKATIETNQTIRFSGTGISTAGDSMATSIEWTATGGSITADGVLSAHATGTLRVIGKALGHNKSDTSTVVVVPPQPTLTSIVVSPDPATVTEGKTASFSASGKLSDGSTAPIGVVWSATGGTIDAGGNYSAGMTPGAFRVVATNTSSTVADTVPVTVTAAQLAQIVLAPATVTLVPGGTQQFIGYGRTSTGDSISTPVSFTATGGTVSAGGLYTAGQTTGTFRVIATSTTTNLADTSAVTIQPAALAQLILLPALATVATGGTVQFQVYGRTTAGDSFAAQATYSATGGTIGSAGLYTAGSTAGTFRVIAAQVGGTLADTSAVTITAPLAGSCTGVNIAAGASIQGAVNNNPTGTTFCLGTGTFVQQSVVPKSGDVFVGQGMGVTILDGQNAAGRAFSIGVAPYANNVTIKNLTVTRYVWPYGPDGMISAANSADPLTQYSTGWVIDSVEASYSGASALGIRVGYGTTVRNCHIHHNWLLGMGGTGDGVLIENNEIAFNNYQNNSDPSDEAGGFKFVRTNNLVVRNNYSHDNHGIGMWTDGWNYNYLNEGNRVENNAHGGIMHEISLDAVIRNNIVTGNGLVDFHWGYGAGILAASSPNVEVYGNTVTNNARGIVGIGSTRAEDPALFILKNFYVHDNTVTMTNVATDAGGTPNGTGIVQDAGDLTYFTGKNNRFVHNAYHLGSASGYFFWMNGVRTEQQWAAYGQDVTGTFIR